MPKKSKVSSAAHLFTHPLDLKYSGISWLSDDEYAESIIVRLPKGLAENTRKKYNQMRKHDRRKANLYLLDIRHVIDGGLDIGSSDDDLFNLSLDLVNKARVILSEYQVRKNVSVSNSLQALDVKLQTLCLSNGVRYPDEFDREQIHARLMSGGWWIRRLRVVVARRAEGVAIDANVVHKHKNVYVSDDTLGRRKSQNKRNQDTMQHVKMLNRETGQVATLAELAAGNVSNKSNRKDELITRMVGFEDLAKKYGHDAEFITVTCPSRMHATLYDGKANPKYDGTRPDQAQDYLVKQWARCRALLAKHGIKFYGLRVVEPHHDGTPHWHLILFYEKSPENKNLMRWAFQTHFLMNDNPNELGAKKRRVTFESIDPSKGTAVGYIMKYIGKNIDGIKGQLSDEADEYSEVLADRVEAWASCWGIRQFQQLGGHYISVWRELRRVPEEKLQSVGETFKRLWATAQRQGDRLANFASFIEYMGGLNTSPSKSKYFVEHDYIDSIGQFGKTILRVPLGVGERFGRDCLPSDRGDWIVL